MGYTVEVKVDDTLASCEVQGWIDDCLLKAFPDIEAKIVSGCDGHCKKAAEMEIFNLKSDNESLREELKKASLLKERAKKIIVSFMKWYLEDDNSVQAEKYADDFLSQFLEVKIDAKIETESYNGIV